MDTISLETVILKAFYGAWLKDTDASIDSLSLDLADVEEKQIRLVLDDLEEGGFIESTSIGGFYSLTTDGVVETEKREIIPQDAINENVKARSAIVQRAFDVRENEGRHADVNIDDVISDFELREEVAFRNARLMEEIGWIKFRTARLYAITPFGRESYREQSTNAENPVSEKEELVFETMSDSYRITGRLGQGGVGTVYEVVDASGRKFALKIISENVVSNEKVKRFNNELRFLARNSHRNLVTVVDEGFVEHSDRKIPFYVMPKYDSTLRHLIGKSIPPDKIIKYFEDMLSGVAFLHSKNIYHRDLKPENVLYDASSDQLLIADLGAAHFAEEELHTLVETKPSTRLANFRYAAPEQRERGKEVTHLADLFALGSILNEMFTNSVPHGEEYPKIGDVNINYAFLDDIVARLIKHRQENRYQSIEDLLKDLRGTGIVANSPQAKLPDLPQNAPANASSSVTDQGNGAKTDFEKLLEEMDRFRGESARRQQKYIFLNSQQGAEAAFAAFNRLVEIVEDRFATLKDKDSSFEIEKFEARRALVIRSTGYSTSFGFEVNQTSGNTEFHLFRKYWKGLLSLDPNVYYFDPEWKPQMIDEVRYTADIDGANRMCWLNDNDNTRYYSSNEIVDQSLSWLVNQVIAYRREQQ